MNTADRILAYIKQNNEATGHELSGYLEISDRAVRKQLKNLLEKGKVAKIGKPPKVFYVINSEVHSSIDTPDDEVKKLIDKRYIFISASGELKEGWEGFSSWCRKTNQDPIKTADDYVTTLRKFDAFSKNGLINGLPKMKNSFREVFLDKLFYLDFYSIERFGKTKLGQLLLYAKQSQNKNLIRQIADVARPKIIEIIKEYDIDGVLFIPPTVKRELQLIKELESLLKLPTRSVAITKVKTEIIVPQKTLSKLDDRIENAQKSMIVEEKGLFKNLLLIDDAVGSGATLNEIARKIKEKGIVSGKIIGLAITGSFKGFDVISEV